MKKIFLLTLVGLAGLQVSAQNIDKIITRDYADHLIKTLSSDEMQGRATFSPGIDKAATFIEAEFKKIGLTPLTGETSFRQSFYKYGISGVSKSITIDGKDVSADNAFVMGVTTESVSLTKANTSVVKLDPSKPFATQIRAISQTKANQLILVDAKLADGFKRYKAHFDQPTALDEKDMEGSESAVKVLVLSTDTVAGDFSIKLTNKVEKRPLFMSLA